MKIEKRLLLYIFLIPIIGMFIGMSGGMYLINYTNKLSKEEGAVFLKHREIELQKKKLKILVNAVINNIIILQHYKTSIIDSINKIYPPHKDNYIFIYKINNLNGGKNFAKMLINSNRPDLIGKQIDANYKDVKGFAFRKEMLRLIRKQGFAFVTYYYKKPHTKKIIQKISYFKYYKPLNLIIASGVYLDDINIIISHYKTHLDSFNHQIIKQFVIMSVLIFLLLILSTLFISKILLKEFKKFRKAISRNEKKLRYKLYVDELTKLKSRKALIEDIQKKKFDCLVLVDIDNFRNINQFYGADIGDKYLYQFAILLKEFKKEIKQSLILYRIGSDEFAISILNSDKEKTNHIVTTLNQFLHNNKIIINHEVFDTDATIIFSNFPDPLKKALLTLTEAKNNNKNLLCYSDIEHQTREKEFVETKRMLKEAIEKEQIKPFAQPIVNKEKKVIKYELLMRIVTPNRVIPPYFLEDAKRAKLYNQLSYIMIKRCFEFIEKTDTLCSINIDMQDIENDEIVNLLKSYMQKVNKPVVFEILESESFKKYDELKLFIQEFKKYGVLFAIDDFGSGYSNYAEILQLEPNYLKIDGSLIKDIATSRKKLILLESILYLTNSLNIKTTAEFVENEEIFNTLKVLGINEFQGYYFSKPLPLDELDK